MPTIGGNSISWNEVTPTNKSDVSEGNEYIMSIKTSIRSAMDAEHNWPTISGSGFGYHVRGSARPYYGLQSAVSSTQSDGRLMLTSDTSRLFSVGTGGTNFLGGPTVPLMGSDPSVPQRHAWVEEFGTVTMNGSGVALVTIPNSGFSGFPYTFLTVMGGTASSADRETASVVTYLNSSQTQIAIVLFDLTGGVYQNDATVLWRSIGTRAL